MCQARELALLIRPGHFGMGSEKGSEVTGVQKNLSFGSNIWEAKDAVGGEPGKERRLSRAAGHAEKGRTGDAAKRGEGRRRNSLL